MDALFAAAAFRWDTFTASTHACRGGARLPALLYKTDNHRISTTLGYDFTYDDYRVLPDAPRATPPRSGHTLVARVLRLDNRLTEVLTYLGGIEGLLNIEFARDTRVNLDNALRSHVGGNFARLFELQVQPAVGRHPGAGRAQLDTQTVASLIYTLI